MIRLVALPNRKASLAFVNSWKGTQTMADPREFAEIMAFLSALFPHHNTTDATIQAYYAILSDLPGDVLKAAVEHIASQDGRWFPSAGKLRAAAFELMQHQDGAPSAMEAWGEVSAAFGTNGRDRLPEWTHELIGLAVQDVGGWRGLCDSPIEMVASDRARFVQAYEGRVRREQTDTRMLPGVRQVVERLAMDRPVLTAGAEQPIDVAFLEGER